MTFSIYKTEKIVLVSYKKYTLAHDKIYCLANWIKLFKSCCFRFFFMEQQNIVCVNIDTAFNSLK